MEENGFLGDCEQTHFYGCWKLVSRPSFTKAEIKIKVPLKNDLNKISFVLTNISRYDNIFTENLDIEFIIINYKSKRK